MKLSIRESGWLDDWYVIERADCSRFSDADVEGSLSEMWALADAIETRGNANFKRCAVEVNDTTVQFWSPRNSRVRGEVSLEEADGLARQIRSLPAPEVSP